MMGKQNISKWVYTITIAFLTLSGFGQMPIFKRYYIADIPGLAWLAKFYITHLIHYMAAIILIIIAAYFLFDFLFKRQPLNTITPLGAFGFVSLLGLLLSGALMVIKNLSGIYFNHTSIIALDIIHLSLCMVLMTISFYTLITKKRWVGLD